MKTKILRCFSASIITILIIIIMLEWRMQKTHWRRRETKEREEEER